MLLFKYICQYEAADGDLPDAPCPIVLDERTGKPLQKKKIKDFEPLIETLTKQCQIVSRSQDVDTYIFLSRFSKSNFCICAISNLPAAESDAVDKMLGEIFKPLNITICKQERKELLLKEIKIELDNAADEEFIVNPRAAIKTFDINFDAESYFCENSIPTSPLSLKDALKVCDDLSFDKSVSDEIERIFQPSNGIFGVPVHYVINSMNSRYTEQIFNLIAQSLRQNGRSLRDKFGVLNLSTQV